jgi:NAD(P)-dependent dehydrogenase (short-subunit alcohol dehydrogenase family)
MRVTDAAAKGGVLSLTRQLAVEYASGGVRVNSVSPGTINTPLVASVLKLRGTSMDEAGEIYPGGRIGEPHEVANAVLWLSSDEATFVTGQNLVVDGGLMSFGRWAGKA